MFESLDKEKLHHAYLLEGSRESIVPVLFDFLESKLKFQTKGNPDFWHSEFDTCGIDEARNLKELQSRKAMGERKVFVVCAHSFTREAQNALLKVLEEPTQNTHFFIVTANTQTLLPTLKSRMAHVSLGSVGQDHKGNSFVEGFLKASKPKRLELVKEIIDAKDKGQAIEFLNNLELALYKNIDKDMTADQGRALTELQSVKKYLHDRSPSVKILLEHIALVVPQSKIN